MSVTVVDLGGGSTPAALERAGSDGDVLVVHESPDRLEELRRTYDSPNVFFLLGCAEVLPLPDASADAVLGASSSDEAQRELARVLRA
jgi:ubiquinone/menaquinone biosynthesis C-methylase UbiE